ncbi:biotin--[acetyl-CoA-carboxylase] ligase [Dyadobacter tibetensis]|uniref:biotin--[acetyl-CoA-carboxylase] ligase n=1 Tax=Dyadobacter tibetensis TaxID=1211851 RepID=UPI00047090C1|nr:biotin--[acetyl-CoA-carboxylase] ligase [Dyadobacter tibetensis]
MYNSISNTGIIGKKIVYLPTCHSTNDIAAELVRAEGFEEGAIVITDHQTNGRGQRGTAWESRQGSNLMFSLALTPANVPIMQQFLLSQMVALGLVQFLKTIGLPASIKWPNDVYVEDRKICGTLIENSIQGNRISSCIAGIGLNVNQLEFQGIRATSLALETKKTWSLEEALDMIIKELNAYYAVLISGEFRTIRAHYLDNLLGLNETRNFRIANKVFQGQIVGINDYGHLLLLKTGTNHPLELDLKEVEWIWDN